MDRDIRHILEEVQNGGMSVDSAYLKLKEELAGEANDFYDNVTETGRIYRKVENDL